MKRLFVAVLMGACSALSVNAQEHKLWYDKPASHWLEALPVGNSHLGAMVFGETDGEEIQLNEETFWSGSPHDNNSPEAKAHLQEVRDSIFAGKEMAAHKLIDKYFFKGPHGQKYLTLGSLKLNGGQDFERTTNFRRELNLQTAICTTTYKDKLNGVTYTREVFASQADNVIVMHLKADKKGKLDFSLSHWCNTALKNSSSVKEGELVATIQNVEHEGIAGALTAEVRALVKSDGTFDNTPDMIVVNGATEATIYITAATNYVNYHDVSGHPTERTLLAMDAVKDKSYDELLKRHLEKYQEQYNRVKLDLAKSEKSALPTEQRLANFDGTDLDMVSLMMQYGRYLLISSSQPGGQPANLQGVWNSKLDAPWDSKYTININAEMNYWPALVGNLAETQEPLFSMIRDLSETGAKTAKEMYGCDGWVAHHNTDLWRIAGPVDGTTWGMFPTGGAWLTTHIWQHYLYTGDKQFLEEYYPVMKGAADFFLYGRSEVPG